jgi:hypothetical protein
MTSDLAGRYLALLNKQMQSPAYTNKRAHHYVSQCVQKSFAVDENKKKTWRLCLQYKLVELRSISGILFEPHIYRGTGRLGPEDSRLEEVFSVIEDAAAPALAIARANPRQFIEDVRQPDSLNRYKISMLLASLGLRSPLLRAACAEWNLSPEVESSILEKAEEECGLHLSLEDRTAFIEYCKDNFEWKDGILAALGSVAGDLFRGNWHFLLVPEKVKTAFVLPDAIGIARTPPHVDVPDLLFPLTPKLALSVGSRFGYGIEHVSVMTARQINEDLVRHAKQYVVGQSEAQLKSLLRPR